MGTLWVNPWGGGGAEGGGPKGGALKNEKNLDHFGTF